MLQSSSPINTQYVNWTIPEVSPLLPIAQAPVQGASGISAAGSTSGPTTCVLDHVKDYRDRYQRPQTDEEEAFDFMGKFATASDEVIAVLLENRRLFRQQNFSHPLPGT